MYIYIYIYMYIYIYISSDYYIRSPRYLNLRSILQRLYFMVGNYFV